MPNVHNARGGYVGKEELRNLKVLELEQKAMHNIRKGTQADVLETAKATKAIEAQQRYRKIRIALFTSLILMVGIFVLQRVVSILTRYRKMIHGLNQNKPSDWPASGFQTAAVVEIPALAGLMHFKDTSLPLATYFCYSTQSVYEVFQKNEQANLQAMFELYTKGPKDAEGPSGFNAITLVCKSWYAKEAGSHSLCFIPCPIPGINGWSIATTALSGGTGVGFGAHAFITGKNGLAVSNPPLAGGITTAAVVVGGTLSAISAYHNAKRQRKYQEATQDSADCI